MNYLVRVLSDPATGEVTLVIHPAMNDRSRPAGVSDDVWALRCLDRTMEKRPEWGHYNATDMRVGDLPYIAGEKTRRHAWRITDGRCMADPNVPDPVKPPTLEDRVSALERQP